jgi:DNA-binding GntR family transcriptional regulator
VFCSNAIVKKPKTRQTRMMSEQAALDHHPIVSLQNGADRSSLTVQAYAGIKRLITENAFGVGDFILEQDLANRLGMSRTPVREALIRLVQEGLVEVRPRHGMRVLPISPQDMAEIYDIITALETLAVENAASRRHSQETLAALDQTIAGMDAALAADDLLAWAEADESFHRMIVVMGGNAKLAAAVNTYLDQVRRARMFTLRLRPKPTASNADHAAVVKAIRDGKPGIAATVHREHRQKSCAILTQILEKLQLRSI